MPIVAIFLSNKVVFFGDRLHAEKYSDSNLDAPHLKTLFSLCFTEETIQKYIRRFTSNPDNECLSYTVQWSYFVNSWQGYFGAMGCLLELMRTGTDDEGIITDEDSDTEDTHVENVSILLP